MTKFEKDLKVYFPQIYRLHELGKEEPHLWELMDEIIDMRIRESSGYIRVNYNKGHIDSIHKLQDILAFKRK